MEEDKKKKKNKKKKTKQVKALEDVKVNSGETTLSELNHTSASGQNNHTQISEEADVRSSGILQADVKPGRDHSNSTKGANLDETEKWLWLQKEATFEEKVKQLEMEKDSCMQREAVLEKKLTDLRKEKDFWLQQEASMDQKIKEFLNEKANWTLKGANLEDRIKHLENDKESWILKEDSTKETIDRLAKDCMELQAQVKVLQESRDGVLQENQQLMERIAYLQHLEEESSFSVSSPTKAVQHDSKDEDRNVQIEAAGSLLEKQIIENTELVEKVSDPVVQVLETSTVVDNDVSEFHDTALNLRERVESPAIIQTTEEDENEKVEQIPLDVQDVNDEIGVPLADAPLTGAPFRFISFVARYVSGADLVNKTNSISRR